MKKIIILLVIVLLLTSCKTKINDYEIEFDEIKYCDKEINNYYNNVYLVCLNEIYLINENKITLKHYFSKMWHTFDDALNNLLSGMKSINENKYKKGDLEIIRCNNGNIYISNKDIDENYYCNLLENLKENIIKNVNIKNYDNYIGSKIENEFLIVELLNNNEIEQEYFKKEISNSKYIIFKDGNNHERSNNSDFLFNYRNNEEKLLNALNLGIYGHYKFRYDNDTLEIKYIDIEGWGDILRKEDILNEKSQIILALTKANTINWINPNNRKTIKLSDFDNLKYYGSSAGLFNELMKKLGYTFNPIKFETSNLTSGDFNLNIINNSNMKYLYGEEFNLQELVDGVYRDVNLNLNFISIGYTLLPKSNRIMKINFGKLLPNGKYRIIKEFTEILSETESGFNFGKQYYIFENFEINKK